MFGSSDIFKCGLIYLGFLFSRLFLLLTVYVSASFGLLALFIFISIVHKTLVESYVIIYL